MTSKAARERRRKQNKIEWIERESESERKRERESQRGREKSFPMASSKYIFRPRDACQQFLYERTMRTQRSEEIHGDRFFLLQII